MSTSPGFSGSDSRAARFAAIRSKRVELHIRTIATKDAPSIALKSGSRVPALCESASSFHRSSRLQRSYYEEAKAFLASGRGYDFHVHPTSLRIFVGLAIVRLADTAAPLAGNALSLAQIPTGIQRLQCRSKRLLLDNSCSSFSRATIDSSRCCRSNSYFAHATRFGDGRNPSVSRDLSTG
jgi:hypothetical protein